MAKNKTTPSLEDVTTFIQSFSNSEIKIYDSVKLIELMKKVTGCEPYMWGPSIVGFGSYHYTYESGHQGEAPVLGFSPRKAAISLYVFTGLEEHKYVLNDLGKFKIGKACIYIKTLADIDTNVLEQMMRESVSYIENTYTRLH